MNAVIRRFATALTEFCALRFARPVFYRLNRAILRLGLRGVGVLNWETSALRGEDDLLLRILGDSDNKHPVVLDVGANVGDYSATVLAAQPGARIYAFEPHPDSFEKLSGRFAETGVKCHRLAVAANPGKVLLYDYESEGGSGHASLLEGVFSEIHHATAKPVEVEQATLSDFLTNQAITDVFLIKIDVEGSELDVLKGLRPSLERNEVRIDYLQIEFNEMNVIRGVFLRDLSNLLPEFRVHRILPRGRTVDITDERHTFRELFGYQNLLFVAGHRVGRSHGEK